MSETFDVFFSYRRGDREIVYEIAAYLSKAGIRPWIDEDQLPPGRPWLDGLHEAMKASKAAAVFIGPHGIGDWQLPEVRYLLDRMVKSELPVIPVLLPGAPQEPALEFLAQNTWVDLRGGLGQKDLDRLVWGINGQRHILLSSARPALLDQPTFTLTKPGWLRYQFDRITPRLHLKLTRLGTLVEPLEFQIFNDYLRQLHGQIENAVREETYIPLRGTRLSTRAFDEVAPQDPFVRPIHQVIYQISGRANGGDAATAAIAAVNRRSRVVKDILGALLKTDVPLILLGDPGSGKTMSLQMVVLSLAGSEIHRVFPRVVLYVRLGEFRVESGAVGPDDVLSYVKRCAPIHIRSWIDELDRQGRLILLFDGMDEMSREHYADYAGALSIFAGTRKGRTKTLFTCRVTDFSPTFVHRRLVLLLFNRSQIKTYLLRYFLTGPVIIDDEVWSLPRLAARLASGGLPIDATNPFILWLLCVFLQEYKTWPDSRAQLLEFFLIQTFQRKREEAEEDGLYFPDREIAFHEWSRIAFAITERNQGSAIPIDLLQGDHHRSDGGKQLANLLAVGKRCGILTESIHGEILQVRFQHHRFQEFFTALYIVKENLSLEWLDKLDAPRWQETVLNLVLLGGGEDCVRALVSSISSAINALQEDESLEAALSTEAPLGELDESESPEDSLDESEELILTDLARSEKLEKPLTESEELILADRIEFGVRLFVDCEEKVPAVKEALKPCLDVAVKFLVEKGNPLSQVKMMRACQRTLDLDLHSVIEKPLRSPIKWVRDQALLLVAVAQSQTRIGKANLATEIGFDLADNRFLRRWLIYAKAATRLKNTGAWWCFALATILSLTQLPLITILAIRAFSWDKGAQEIGMALASVVMITAVLTLYRKPSLFWLWVPSAAWFSRQLFNIGTGLWFGVPGEILKKHAVDDLFAAIIIICGAGVVISVLHTLVLLIYLALTVGLRGRGYALFDFVRFCWEECVYLFPYIFSAMLALAMVWPHSKKSNPSPPLATPSSGFDFFAGLLFTIAVWFFVFGILGVLAGRGNSPGETWRGRFYDFLGKWLYLIETNLEDSRMRGMLLAVAVLFLPPTFLYLVGVKLTVLLLAFIRTHSLMVSRVVIAGMIVASIVICLRYLALLIRFIAAGKRIFPPNSFDPDEWKSQVRRANPWKQREFLRRSTHQSLGLSPKDYLDVLREIRDVFRREPAASIYWNVRDQLEQALKQERQG